MVEELLETLNISSPDNSSEDETSSDDSSGEEVSPGPSVKKVQETPESRREARAQEFAENISNEKVIETLNITKLASKSKVKKVMSKKGRSYTHAAISKYNNFSAKQV